MNSPNWYLILGLAAVIASAVFVAARQRREQPPVTPANAQRYYDTPLTSGNERAGSR